MSWPFPTGLGVAGGLLEAECPHRNGWQPGTMREPDLFARPCLRGPQEHVACTTQLGLVVSAVAAAASGVRGIRG